MPGLTTEILKSAADEFMKTRHFPNCAGCVDGKHVRIKCPPNSASMFYNYKQFHSVILQGVADAKSRFLCIDVGGYGRQSDSGVFQTTPLYKQLEDCSLMPENRPLPYSGNTSTPPMPYVFLGDQGYPLKTYLLKPYHRNGASETEEHFNNKLSSVRRVIECAFGIVVAKWRVLKTEIQCSPDKVDIIVKCVCLLHNIVIDKEGSAQVDNYIAECTTCDVVNNERHADLRRNNRATHLAISIRDSFKNYFTASRVTNN